MKRFKYAFNGIWYGLKSQQSMRLHLIAVAIVVSAGTVLELNRVEWALVVGVIGLVLAAELFNTSIESLLDMVTEERDEKAGLIKDVAAGSVLVAAVVSVIVGVIVFLPKIILLI